MSYLVVENFNGGLDGRRHVLAAKPGTLAKLNNAHITRGGEIEKRKTFGQAHDFQGMHAFGMISGKDTLYTFFSAGYNPGHRFVYNSTIPGITITAICLFHPFKAYYTVSLTGIVSSTLFGGKPLVIAEWSDGSRHLYYDGFIVSQSIGGVIPDNVNALLDIGNPFRESYLCYHLGRMINNGEYEGYEPFEPRADGYLYVHYNGKMHQETFYAQSSVVLNNQDPGIHIFGPVGKQYEVTISSSTDTFGAQDYLAMYSKVLEPATPTTPAKDSTAGLPFTTSNPYSFRFCRPTSNNPLRFGSSNIDVFPTGFTVKAFSVNGRDLSAYDVVKTAGQSLTDYFQALADSINVLTQDHGFYAYAGAVGSDQGGVTLKEVAAGVTIGTATYSVLFNVPGYGDVAVTSTGNDSYFTGGVQSGKSYAQYNAWGINSATQGGGVKSITVNGVDILLGQVNYTENMSDFAQRVVNKVNLNTATHGYTAQRNVTQVNITKPGSAANGSVVNAVIHGSMAMNYQTVVMGLGANAVVGTPQKTFVGFKNGVADLAAAKTAGLEMTISITVTGDDNVYTFGSDRIAGIDPSILFTYQGKGYMTEDSVFYFSALNDVSRWDRQATGAGFIDASNNLGIRDDITGIGIYQGKVAIFTRNDVQVWNVDPDPSQNRLMQSIGNTGCIAPKSVTSFGSIDVFYLSDSGLRSLRARDASDAAFMADVGHPIDNFILEQFKTLTEEQKAKAIGVIDPSDGRYWLCINNRIYVYSYFPGSSIAAWSTYDLGIEQDIEAIQVLNGRIFVKTAGDDINNGFILVYGGINGHTYDDCLVEVELPYLDGSKPATYKSIKGIDATCEGEWVVNLGFDHTNPTSRDKIATLTQSTFALGKIEAVGIGTHIGPRLTSQFQGYVRLANFIVHYDEMHSKHEAG